MVAGYVDDPSVFLALVSPPLINGREETFELLTANSRFIRRPTFKPTKCIKMHEWPQCESCTAALVVAVKVWLGPSLLAQHDPLAEHAATDQILAESLLYRVSATQLTSAIEINGVASAFTFGLFTCQFTLTTNGFFFLARFAN